MQVLIFTLSLLVAWSAMSYYSWQDLRLNQWWDRLYQERRFDALQIDAQLQSQHYRYFAHPGKKRKQKKDSPVVATSSVEQEDDPKISRRDDIPLRLSARRSFPENMRFPVEKAVILQENQHGKRWQEAWQRLLHNLYGSYAFYQVAQDQDKDIALQLLKQIITAIEKKSQTLEQKTSARSSLDLQSLQLEDPQCNLLWQQMLSSKQLPGDSMRLPSLLRFVWFKDWITAPEVSAVNIHYCEYPVLEAILGKKAALEIWKQRLGLLAHALQNDSSFQVDRIECYYMQDHVLQNLLRSSEQDLPFPYSDLRKYISFKTSVDGRENVETVVLASRYGGKAQDFEIINPRYKD